jgi:hypothetical protein
MTRREELELPALRFEEESETEETPLLVLS